MHQEKHVVKSIIEAEKSALTSGNRYVSDILRKGPTRISVSNVQGQYGLPFSVPCYGTAL